MSAEQEKQIVPEVYEKRLKELAELLGFTDDELTLTGVLETYKRGIIDEMLQHEYLIAQSDKADMCLLPQYQCAIESLQIPYMDREGILFGSLLVRNACHSMNIEAAIQHYEEDPQYFFPYAISLILRIEETPAGPERDALMRLAEKTYATMSLCESYQYCDYRQERKSKIKTQYSFLLGYLSHICVTGYLSEIFKDRRDFRGITPERLLNIPPFSLLGYENVLLGSFGIAEDHTNAAVEELFSKYGIPVPDGSIIEKAFKGLMSRVLDINRLSGESNVDILARLYRDNPDTVWGENLEKYLSDPDSATRLRPDIVMRQIAMYNLGQIFVDNPPRSKTPERVISGMFEYVDPQLEGIKRPSVDNELYKFMLGIPDTIFADYLVKLLQGESGYNGVVTFFDGQHSIDLGLKTWNTTLPSQDDLLTIVQNMFNQGQFVGFFLNLPYDFKSPYCYLSMTVPLEVMIVPKSSMDLIHSMRPGFKQAKMGTSHLGGSRLDQCIQEMEMVA